MTLAHRVQTGLALAVVFLLILATNRMDQRHFRQVQDTLTTVFDDRVLAQDYIYRLDNVVHAKALRLAEGRLGVPAEEDRKLEELIQKFAKTRLTRDERDHFERFVADAKKLRVAEAAEIPPQEKVVALRKSIASMEETLDELAAVQVEESHRLTKGAQVSLDSTDFTSKIEIGILIVIGVIIQLLVFLKPWGGSLKKKTEHPT